MWMLVRILAKAGERIAEWNYVYVIRTWVPETGDASGNDGKGKDDADVDDQRCDQKLRFVGGSQGRQNTVGGRERLRKKGKSDLTFGI